MERLFNQNAVGFTGMRFHSGEYAVFSAKGGCGATTVAANLAGALRRHGGGPDEEAKVVLLDFDLEMVRGVKSMFFGGEGMFFARLTGPGKVWVQSLPFARLAGRMMAAASGSGGNRGEGSVLGGLGDLIGGND